MANKMAIEYSICVHTAVILMADRKLAFPSLLQVKLGTWGLSQVQIDKGISAPFAP